MLRVKEGRCASCVVAMKPFSQVCLIHKNDREKNIFLGDITFITLLKTSDLL